MAVNVYEGMFIFDANRYARDPGGVPRRIDDEIKQLGGEVLVSRLWAEQKLAYPIKGQGQGTYWLTYFRLDSDNLTKLNHQNRLNDNVLRSLVIRIDPRLVDARVSHASSGGKSTTPTEAGEKKEETKQDTDSGTADSGTADSGTADSEKKDEPQAAEPAAADS